MADINLLQSEGSSRVSRSYQVRAFVSKILTLVLVVAVLFYGFLMYDSSRAAKNTTQVKADIAKVQSDALQNKNRNELVTRQGQLKELNTLIDNHLYWSYLLPELARVSLRSAKYTNVEADSNGKLILSVSLPSYDDLEKFMQIFDLPEYNQQFSNVKILSISKTQQENSIETLVRVQLTFNPEYIKGRM